MEQQEDSPSRKAGPQWSRGTACAFEIGLGLLALVLGWLVGFSPLRSLQLETFGQAAAYVGWGLLGVLPMLGMLALIERSRQPSLIQFRAEVRDIIGPLFHDASWPELAMLALAAGVGEELLFRGLLQDGLARGLGLPNASLIALGATSLVFAACHWVTRTYALLAGLAGLYLGGMFLLFNHLGPPIVTHAVYDFLALLYLLRRRD
jgi:membrane protease YdiL (CAAX protease family)